MGNTNTKKSQLSIQNISDLRQHVNFDDEEIKEWYEEFLKNSNSGQYLTKESFHKIYNKLFAGDATEFANEVFRSFDVDGDGRVNFKEFLIGLSVTSCSDSEKKLKWAFDMYDKDGNGVISLEEMEEIIRAVCKMVSAFTNIAEETEPPEKIAKRIFEKMDVDGNQQVTWEEFQRGAKEDESVVRLLLCDPAGH